GINIELGGGAEVFTFELIGGKAIYQGTGISHEQHSSNKRSFILRDFAGPVVYYINIYPTKAFSDQFHTNFPYYVMCIAVFVVLFTSSIFLLYDFMMTRSATERELVMEIETKRLFVRYISHEIRTPLQTIAMGLQLLSGEILACAEMQQLTSLPPEVALTWTEQMRDWRILISQLEESSGIATMVLNDLINHDKIVMGSLSMELELVSLWHAISTAVKPFYLNARQAAVRLVVDSEFEQEEGEEGMSLERKCVLDSLMVVGDSVKLSQVVRNLVSNALKFSSPGGEVTVTVRWDPGGLRDAPAVPTGSSSGTISIAGALTPGVSSRHVHPPWTGMPRAGSLVLTVRDRGAGMSAEDQKNLFREGIQFNANQLQHGGGSGLGLWIAKGVVELHNGLLFAHSDGEGLGSEFRCELPLVQMPILAQPKRRSSLLRIQPMEIPDSGRARIPTHNTAKPSPNPTRIAPTPSPTRIAPTPSPTPTITPTFHSLSTTPPISRVLVVDDSGLSRKVLCRLLKNNGYLVEEAVDGVDCVEQMQKQVHESSKFLEQDSGMVQDLQEFDLILMDFEMPRMNGPTATKTLRDMGCNLPIVGVTGNVLADDLQFFVKHGLNYVLTKPVTAELLLETISKCNEARMGAGTGAGTGAEAGTGTGAGVAVAAGAGVGPRRVEPKQLRPVPVVRLPSGSAVVVGDENV
ncbi:hypothetical protein B484DRAFT_405826, partial [Ochromonadaceae sp. CCMP2298]